MISSSWPKYNEGDSMLIFEQDSVYIDPLPNGEHDLQVIQYSWVLDYSKIVNIQSRVVGHGGTLAGQLLVCLK